MQSPRRVGSNGVALSYDFLQRLTDLTNAMFRAENVTHAKAFAMDGEDLDVETEYFDAVISPWGFFFPDQMAP